MAEEILPPGASPQKKPEKKKGGLFVIKSSKSKDIPVSTTSPQELSALSGRMRVLEERLYNLRRKTQLTDQNLLSHNKKIVKEFKDLNAEMKDMRMDMEDLRTVIQQIINEMKKFAAKNELETLRRYIDLWEPLEFMRREEAEKLIKDTIQGIVK